MPDLSNDEISVQGEYHRCEACGIESRDADLFDVDTDTDLTSTGDYATVCAFGYGCRTWEDWSPSDLPGLGDAPNVDPMRTLPERDPDEGHDDAVDAALERTTNGNTN